MVQQSMIDDKSSKTPKSTEVEAIVLTHRYNVNFYVDDDNMICTNFRRGHLCYTAWWAKLKPNVKQERSKKKKEKPTRLPWH